ncbi:Protein ERD1-like protein [Lachnellula suecica]|uniref:Protein ERD1-like protein n=1 Tax=Lachnellula suecica TaxID=602035 RepID=A0A8T9CFW0_9HELO|nr:Protein ERD1-like protein [Lachnellula suecica]
MDGDPAVEPDLDSFSLTLPLPYRVALVVDVPSLLHYPARPSPRTDTPHHLSTYRLATLLSIPLTISFLLFWALSHRNPTLVIYYDFLPFSYLCFLLLIFLLPLRRFSSAGRTRFLTTLRRVSIGGIALPHDGKFGDILLADVLTSYAKIIAELFVALCMFFTPNGSATKRPDRGCGGQYLVPIIIAIPSLIRFRQCITEYLRYFSAFPVIILSALQRNLSVNHDKVGLSETAVYRFWVLAVFVNSFYSFYWDVAKDWDLTLFTAQRAHSGLRQRRYFPFKEMYYVAIGADLLLRCTWSLKLSPHLDHFADFESGIFLMEILEVGRRWMWIFFRVETEWVRNTSSAGLGAPGQDDVLLGDYGSGKEDDD